MNATEIVESTVKDQLKPEAEVPYFSVGDTLNVHVRIIEGDKERIQIFQGVLIADRGRGINRMITVRRIVANEGVERIFPLHSPRIAQIEIVRRGDVRRAKLYYLRKRIGKSRRLRDQRRGLKHASAWEDQQATAIAADEPASAAAAEAAEAEKLAEAAEAAATPAAGES